MGRAWDRERGIVLVDYVKVKVKGNLRQYPIRRHLENRFDLDESSKYYNEYLNVIESKEGFLFMDLIKMLIIEEFDNKEGRYWIGGWELDPKKYWTDNLVKIPVLKIDYYNGEITIVSKRSYSKKWGASKSRATKFYALRYFEDLED